MSLFNALMDGDESGSENAEASSAGEHATTGEASSEPTWWWDKSTPGTGDRPDWLPSQFKSAEDAARSYGELSKKVGTAPDRYDWSKGDGWVEPDYEPFTEFADLAKSHHVPQAVMDKMLDSVGKYLNEFKVDYNEEKELLGENAQERLIVLNNWAKANFTDDTFNALTSSMQTAESVKAIEEIRNKMVENLTSIPTGHEVTGEGAETMDDIQNEMGENFEKYQTDAKYRKEITGRIAKTSKDSNFIDKHY